MPISKYEIPLILTVPAHDRTRALIQADNLITAAQRYNGTELRLADPTDDERKAA